MGGGDGRLVWFGLVWVAGGGMGAAWAAHRELRSLLRWVGACAGGWLRDYWPGIAP